MRHSRDEALKKLSKQTNQVEVFFRVVDNCNYMLILTTKTCFVFNYKIHYTNSQQVVSGKPPKKRKINLITLA